MAEEVDLAVDGPAVLYSGLVRSVGRCFEVIVIYPQTQMAP